MANIILQPNNTQNISQQTNTTIKSSGTIKTGDSVYVRVLSHLGGNKYSVSFAGNRFNVDSYSLLDVGKSFSASVQVQNGKVILVPDFTQTANSANQTVSMQNYLMALGLPNDAFSQQMLQMFMGMGLKFDTKLANRIRLLAAKFVGREKEAAEVALSLFEKGITPNFENVMQLLAVLFGETQNNTSYNQENSDHCEVDSEKEENAAESILKNVYGCSKKILSKKSGMLTLFNHIKGSNNHWLLFPIKFEIPIIKDQTQLSGTGTIRILINTNEKKTEKVKIFLNFADKKYNFVVKCSNVSFYTYPEISKKELDNHLSLLASIIGCDVTNVHYDKELFEQGFFTENSTIPLICTEA